MRYLILFIALFFAPVGVFAIAAMPAQAQTTAEMNEDLQAIGIWSQEMNAFNFEVAAIFDSSEFNTLLSYVDSGDLSSDGAKAAYSSWKVDYKARISKMRQMEASFSPAPNVRMKNLQPILDALVTQRKVVPQMINDIQELCVRLDNIIQRSINGDTSGLEEVADILVERAIKIIELENTSIEQVRATIKSSDHPNYYLMGMTISANNFAIEGLRITSYAETRKEREPYLRVMRQIVILGREQEKEARRALNEHKSGALAMRGKGGPNEKRLVNSIIKLWDEFEVAIDNEVKIFDAFEAQLALYETQRSTTDLETEISKLDNQVYDLIDIRLELADRRTALISTLQ